MKKIAVSMLILTSVAYTSQAQKGTLLVYGTLGINSVKDPEDNKHTEFSINPGFGYQFSNKWTAGVVGGYSRDKQSPATGNGTKISSYKAGAFARYIQVLNAIFSIYGQADFYYHGSKDQEIKHNGFGTVIVPVVGINFTKCMALNISFGGASFETDKVKDADKSTKTFDFNFAKEITIGISVNIQVRK